MPIKNITDQKNLPRIGKIHLGIKDEKKGYPKSTDYFVVKEDSSTPKEAAEAFKEVYGDKPRKLDIIIPCEDVDTFFPQYLKAYNGKKQLVCKGDGEKAQRLQDDGKYAPVVCKGKDCDAYKGKKCKEVANLKFMLPKLPGVGVWQIDTSSVNSIISVNSAIDFIKMQSLGKISGIPLTLSLQPKDIVFEGMKKTVFVLTLSSEVCMNDIAVKIASNENEYPDESPTEETDGEIGVDPDEVEDYPIDTDEAGKENTLIYEIIEIGNIKGRVALKIKKTGEDEPITVLSKDKIPEKKGTKIIAEIEQQGKYNVLLNYKKIA